jgi:hypothetical protein
MNNKNAKNKKPVSRFNNLVDLVFSYILDDVICVCWRSSNSIERSLNMVKEKN